MLSSSVTVLSSSVTVLRSNVALYGAFAQAFASKLPLLQPLCLTMSVRCPDCLQPFKSKMSLSVHQSKFKGTCFVEMSGAEYDLLSPDPDNQREVWRNSCGKSIAKRGIFKHLKDHHPELEADSWDWCVKGDFNLLKRKKIPDAHSPFNVGWTRKAAQDPSSSLVTTAWEAYQKDLSSSEEPNWETSWGTGMEEKAEAHEGHPAVNPDGEKLDEESVAGESVASLTPTVELSGVALDPGQTSLQSFFSQSQLVTVPYCVGFENRLGQRIDQVVGSFNEVLRAGLGEVTAKYPVALPDWFTDFNPEVDGKNFPRKLMSNNINIELFKLTILEFRGLNLRTATNITRDISRFFGCFTFSNAARQDIPNLLVSILKQALLNKLLLRKLWNAKPYYLKTLRISLKHLVDYLENEERILRSFGGLTTALNTIGKALEYELSAIVKNKESQRRANKAQEDAQMIQNWVGSEVFKEMVLNAFKGLLYIYEHMDDDGFWNKWTHYLANQFLIIIIFLNTYPGRCGGWELIEREDMDVQLACELILKNILVFTHHKTAKAAGPVRLAVGGWLGDRAGDRVGHEVGNRSGGRSGGPIRWAIVWAIGRDG